MRTICSMSEQIVLTVFMTVSLRVLIIINCNKNMSFRKFFAIALHVCALAHLI